MREGEGGRAGGGECRPVAGASVPGKNFVSPFMPFFPLPSSPPPPLPPFPPSLLPSSSLTARLASKYVLTLSATGYRTATSISFCHTAALLHPSPASPPSPSP